MSINPEWNLSSLLQEIEGWLREQADFIHGGATKTLAEYAAGAPGKPVPISRQISKLFSWYGAKGAVALAGGDETGLADLRRAHSYNVAFVRIRAALLAQRKAGTIDFNETALTLAYAMSLGAWEDADFIGRWLMDALPRGFLDGIESTRVGPFILGLYLDARRTGRTLGSFTMPFRSMERLAPLIENWRTGDDKKFARAVSAAADFHTFRSGDPTEEDLPEFSDYIYRLWPVEILAVLRAREARGLPFPSIRHPLLEGPLCRLHPPAKAVRDALLDAVLARLQTEIPGL